VRALRAERGVPAMARVDPGLVGQPVEDLRHDAVVERGEAGRVLLGVADAAGEASFTRVRSSTQRDRPGRAALSRRRSEQSEQ
jgi:hypothetical protein